MALIFCPECQAKISSRALACPRCGYVGEDITLPISVQSTFAPAPTFVYDIVDWDRPEPFSVMSLEDNRKLYKTLGKWETIQTSMPTIAEAIQALASRETVLVARMDDYVKKLIEEGVYRFAIDKNGEILPSILGSTGIIKQVRLSEMRLASDLSHSIGNLSTHAAISQVLERIEAVGESIQQLHIELQNDRLALADGARDMLSQALRMQDANLREQAILSAIGMAIEAKRTLMRSYTYNFSLVKSHSQKSFIELIRSFGKRSSGQNATDALQALISLTNAVQLECQGYAALGEYEASRATLLGFRSFISENNLDKRDALLLINESLDQKHASIVDEFAAISERIVSIEQLIASGQAPLALPPFNGGTSDEE